MGDEPIRSLGLWWVRRDLRTADNEALVGACPHMDALLPVYCFDPRDFEPRRAAPEGLGVPKLGALRCRFLLEGLGDLRQELGRLQRGGGGAGSVNGGGGGDSGSGSGSGGGLVVRFGRPETVLPRLLTLVADHNPELRHVSLHHHLDLLEESVAREGAVATALREWAARQGRSVSIHTYWDRTLYHPDDLPYHLYDKGKNAMGAGASRSKRQQQGSVPQSFSLPPNADRNRYRGLPPVMTDFRKATQAAAAVRPSLPAPAALPPMPPPFTCGTLAVATAVSAAAAAQTGKAAAAAEVAVAPCDALEAGPPDPGAVLAGAVDLQHQQQQQQQRGGDVAATATATATATAGGASVKAEGSGLGAIPRTIGEVYDAVGARGALQRLEELVGLDYSQLLPPLEQEGARASPDPRTAFPFHAGHDHAVQRLRYYVWGHPEGPQPTSAGEQPGTATASSPPSLLYFTNTRAQAVGVDNSTKLSPYVALGCITPRRIHEEVERVRAAAQEAAAAGSAAGDGAASEDGALAAAEAGAGGASVAGIPADRMCGSSRGSVPAPAECDWLAMHLCIRDFFIFTVLKEGEAVLDERGIVGQPVTWRRDLDDFKRWARGLTGLPFVDANMRELAATGWMSNRGRQNVASLVTKDMGLDWRWGAELFESLLLDCDVAVNYCNWNYFAGIGNDPRNRHFKTVTQGIKYDEDAVLAATWLPELAQLPATLRHQPWVMTEEEMHQYGIVLGQDYPTPVVDPGNHVGQLTGTGKRKNKAKTRQ